MTAETAYNVYEALSPEEKKRFFKMMGVVPRDTRKPKKRPIMTKTEAKEYVLRHLNKNRN